MNILKQAEKNGHVVQVVHDSDPESPREWDNASQMVCFNKRYVLGDEHEYKQGEYNNWQELKQAIIENEKPLAILPLYLYDHSGITISTKPFSCKWDSGQVGFVYITEKTLDNLGITDRNPEELETILMQEVETYDNYLRGEVYGFQVVEVSRCDQGHEHKEVIDSCYGYYSIDEALSEGLAYA